MDQSAMYKNYAAALSRLGDPSDPNKYASGVAQAKGRIADIQQSNADAAANAAKDASKAQMVLLPNNGGYAFYDGTGKRISINDFSMLTGKRPDEILGNSPNPVDQKFVQDYKTLTAFTNAWVNGDKQTLAKMREADPKTFNTLISNYKSPGEVIKGFTDHWSSYYSPNGQTQNSATPAFAPQAINSPDKTITGPLESAPLSSVLTPMGNNAPPPKPNFLENLDPFSGTKKKYNDYQGYLKSNPWFAYQSALNGQ